MSDADSAEYGARGPVPVDQHTSTDKPVGTSPIGSLDPRAALLARERQVANAIEDAVPDPTGAILLTELQELRARTDLFGTVALMGIWLMGMTIGYAGYVYFKNNPVTTIGESEDA